MRNVAGFALTVSAAFLAVVAVMLNAPALFYMGTAMFATIGACHLQAWLAVRGLRFERVAPASARVGDLVTVEIIVWSERRVRRPLITVLDDLPARLLLSDRTPSLPIAPEEDLAIRTQYGFRPLKRGKYHWSGVIVEGTDALGLVSKTRPYHTATAEITILPRPIPVSVELPAAAGWGISEAESGQTRGAGLEPRGVRAYAPGDSLRHVHWRSSAKTGQLLVKEFEAGTHASAGFIIQRKRGTEIGSGAFTSLEIMCGHAVFLAETFLVRGARVEFPTIESSSSRSAAHERINEIYGTLASIQADSESDVSEEAMSVLGLLPPGSVLFVLLAVADPGLVDAIAQLSARNLRVIPLLYDGNAYSVARHGKIASASEPAYVGRLQGAGASPVVMPSEASA
jgi:uncharacterized protein (DUF58 family)